MPTYLVKKEEAIVAPNPEEAVKEAFKRFGKYPSKIKVVDADLRRVRYYTTEFYANNGLFVEDVSLKRDEKGDLSDTEIKQRNRTERLLSATHAKALDVWGSVFGIGPSVLRNDGDEICVHVYPETGEYGVAGTVTVQEMDEMVPDQMDVLAAFEVVYAEDGHPVKEGKKLSLQDALEKAKEWDTSTE